MSDNKIQTSIILDVDKHRALRLAALEDGVSMNDIVVMQVDRFLERRARNRKLVQVDDVADAASEAVADAVAVTASEDGLEF